MTKSIKCWHFANKNLVNNEHHYAAVGVNEPKVNDIALCHNGYHGSIDVIDALNYISGRGKRAEYIKLSGEIIKDSNKLVASNRVCLARLCDKCTLEVFVKTAKELGIKYKLWEIITDPWIIFHDAHEKNSEVLAKNLKEKMKIK